MIVFTDRKRKKLHTHFEKPVQNIAKHIQRNTALQETMFLLSVSIPKVNKNTLDKTKH